MLQWFTLKSCYIKEARFKRSVTNQKLSSSFPCSSKVKWDEQVVNDTYPSYTTLVSTEATQATTLSEGQISDFQGQPSTRASVGNDICLSLCCFVQGIKSAKKRFEVSTLKAMLKISVDHFKFILDRPKRIKFSGRHHLSNGATLTSLELKRVTPWILVSLAIKRRGLMSMVPRFPITTIRPTPDFSNCKSAFKFTLANISRIKSTPSPLLAAFYRRSNREKRLLVNHRRRFPTTISLR